jgi:DinB superfamily
METISTQIREIVAATQPGLLKIPPESASRKANPDVWSKQEILGHLIDSALNNHQRFVRGALNAAENFPPYNQNRWVEIQGYNEMNWADLVDFWTQCNFHLCRMLDRLPEEALNNPCNIGKDQPVTLGFVIEDYLRHLKLHIEQVFAG